MYTEPSQLPSTITTNTDQHLYVWISRGGYFVPQ